MLMIPAIDLKDGQCVRLRQGKMDDATVFSNDPVEMARQWVDQGARRLHLVDLNGAFAGEPVNAEIVKKIAEAFPKLPIQIGGGIRSNEIIEAYLSAGVNYVIIGTKAVKEPEFVTEVCKSFPGHIIVGIDAKDGKVAIDGWAEVTDVDAVELAQKFKRDGVESIVYTDIARDGMMQGVNVEATKRLAEQAGIPVVASGGVTNIEDVKALCKVESSGVFAAITGRAIYEGTLDLKEAQDYCDSVAS